MIPFPDKKYDIIYADPPWSYSDKGCNGNAAEHYATMTVDEICIRRIMAMSKQEFLAQGGGGLLQITAFCSYGRPTP